MRGLTAWIAAMGLTVFMAACQQPDVPRDHFYRLDPGTPSAFSAPALPGTLEVERFTAVGLTSQRPVVYSEADAANQAFAYHYHFWEESPGAMLQDRMVDYLRAAKIANNVVTPDLRTNADYVVTGRIQRLEQVRSGGTKLQKVLGENGSAKGVLEIELVLRRAKDDTLLHHGIYRHDMAAEGSSVAQSVAALNQCLSKAYSSFLDEIKTKK
ncbi:ABC-type transport auxiliary lipoprotein family protein [Magnetospira sp. QH-2]|uniref:ABC-type transport auxiliary lipoprotein family protein n=1 Tax=Magnetospira sp. (strain QH-2) TaxID=1288970 RepID=UPI0003E80BE5|nr:ABC-type transport auxiliary lipoprotein family protein [Magnetospira sp. QH-2]CCQ74969.1 conserved protein of unknown function [Magnetospira sp. QH-2]